jgi:PAS domain S-box-containing protein
MDDLGLLRSGDAVMAYDAASEIRSWNRAAEKLTGIPASEAIGRRCWEVLCGVDEAGSVVCHAGCARTRLARDGWPLTTQTLLIKTSEGRRRITTSTVSIGSGADRLHINIMRPSSRPAAGDPSGDPSTLPTMTGRQLEVLELLGQGVSAKAIAARLFLSQTTVRNHIRGVLLALGCHSQLEAVAKSRRVGLIG